MKKILILAICCFMLAFTSQAQRYAIVDTKDILEKMDALLNPLQVDAFLFATNSLAVAGLKRINQYGIKVPDELAIISFDESDAFDFFYSPVTYVSQSIADIGREAVKLDINRMEGKTKKTSEIIIEAKLIVRESCGSKAKEKK